MFIETTIIDRVRAHLRDNPNSNHSKIGFDLI